MGRRIGRAGGALSPPLLRRGETRCRALKSECEVENHGIQPDIEVEMDPKLVREGHDPQLEKAVEVVMEMLKKNPPPTYARPPYTNYHQHLPPVQ